MKRIICIITLFLSFLVAARSSDPKDDLSKAENLTLLDPAASCKIAEKIYKNKDLNHKQKLLCLFILTNTSNILQKPLDVIKYGNEALENADNSGDKIIKIKILGIVGNTYQSLQLNEKTRVYLDQAESLLSSAKASDSLNLVKGNIYYLKGMNYFYSLDSDIALSYFNKAINQYLLSKNSLAEINIKLAYLNKAYALIQQKQLHQAAENLKLASVNIYETSRPYPPQFAELQEIFIELGKAKILSLQKKPDLSNEILFRILNLRKNQPARDDIENEIYQLLADNYLQKSDIKQYNYYNTMYNNRVKESNREAAKLVNQLILEEDKRNDSEKESIGKKYAIWILVTSVFFSGLIIFLLIETIRKEQKRKLLKNEAFKNI